MQQAYDLFKQDGEKTPVWIETVIGVNNLKKRLMKLSSIKPGNYLVYDPTKAVFIEPFSKSA
jgi:hypothetical protein